MTGTIDKPFRPIWPLARKVALALATAALLLPAAEIALRVLMPPQVDVPHLRVYPQGFYTWYPGARFTYHNLPGVVPTSAEIRINEDGLRGEPVPRAAGSDELRVLVLGDSFTAGVQLPEEEIYTTLVGETLRRGWPGRVVVMNAGFNGTGTAQQLLHFIYRGLELLPDVVVLQATDNDLDDNMAQSELSLLSPDANGLTASRRAIDPPRWLGAVLRARDWLGNRSLLFYLAYRSAKRLWSGIAGPAAAGSRGARLFASLAHEIVVTANDAGATVVSVDIPEAVRLSADDRPLVDGWRLLRQELMGTSPASYRAADAVAALRSAQARDEQPYLAGDGHLSPSGHRAVAQTLVATILAAVAEHRPRAATDAAATSARRAALDRLTPPHESVD